MDTFKKMGVAFDQVCDAIIRPPRNTYDASFLGSPKFKIGSKDFERTDFELVNKRGHTLQCSHFQPAAATRPKAKLPCVIYCHGNCGNRLDVIGDVPRFLSYNISVLCFDFSGCGNSGGEFISLGYFEKDDLAVVVEHLRASGSVSRIGLWGRSMGAATSLMYGAMDPSIAGMVLDSPFASLPQLATELAESNQVKIPKLMLSAAIKLIKKSIQKKAGFDLNECEPIKYAGTCFIPALFAHGEGDTFIQPHHSKQIQEKYEGDKNLILFEGDHNSSRPEFFYDSVAIFFHNTLLVDEDADLAKNAGEVQTTSHHNPLSYSNNNNNDLSMHDYLFGNTKQSQVVDEDELLQQALLLSLMEAEGKEPTGEKDKK
eukprot:TRINITY_DN1183_c0_g1_i5.p1 TRINITY_DN1183_c0_g1~~TRINITY_DN1183_c0_g1_i5.p1  ORF type:complete len:372 (-),score=96.68 TRINITY_DN1183_c0_g1_i5:140-1255(-)